METFIFAPEIEVAVVSLLWKQPERLAFFLRDLDPAVHLTQPRLRYIVEALRLAYSELGFADWATVVGVLREMKRYEDCGELLGLNEVYTAAEVTPVTDQVFAHYLQMLKTYAVNRNSDPPRNVYRFTGGRGTLLRNKVRRRESDPDFIGEARIGDRLYTVGASLASDGSFMNFRFEPKL